jgi:hypothetical protein
MIIAAQPASQFKLDGNVQRGGSGSSWPAADMDDNISPERFVRADHMHLSRCVPWRSGGQLCMGPQPDELRCAH